MAFFARLCVLRGFPAAAFRELPHRKPLFGLDPVAKGEKIPDWMKKIVSRLVMEDDSYGYCPTQGLLETREFLVAMNNGNGHCRITPDDIIFFNGL
jgi:aspartate/methionine/tyrosine aminotransferase